MVRLSCRQYGDTKHTEHETWPAAHHALMKSAAAWDYDVVHDIDTVKGTISGAFTHAGRVKGSFIIGEVKA